MGNRFIQLDPTDRRDFVVKMYLKEEEYEDLDRLAIAQGLKQSVLLRRIVMPIIRQKVKELKK